MKFSPYTQIHLDTLRSLSEQTISLVEQSITENKVANEPAYQAYGHFWLWILASYEITRTMCQHKHCFSDQLGEKICELKKHISKLRMPFSKLEPKGKEKPIFLEAAVRKYDTDKKDFIFEIEGESISLRNTIKEFNGIFNTITHNDVIKSIYGESFQHI